MSDKAPEIPSVPQGDVVKPSENEPTSKFRILAVDDTTGLAEMLIRMANITNKDDIAFAEAVGTPVEALKKYESSDPDLVFTDWDMPGMNGVELAKEIKKRRKEKKDERPFNIVLVTGGRGGDTGPTMDQLKDAGFSGKIQKPYAMDAVKEAINTIKENRKTPPAAPQS